MQTHKVVKIGSHKLSKDSPAFFIAEIGSNHNGKLSQAKELVEAAADSGADAVKFQNFTADGLVNKKLRPDFYKIINRFSLPPEWIPDLKTYADQKGIVFLSTPFDLAAVDLLKSVKMVAYKISSGDITNIPLIRKVARQKKTVLLASGMANVKEIENAIRVIKSEDNEEIVLLYCVSLYPPALEDIDLRIIQTLSERFDLITGFSDHTTSLVIPLAATVIGAKVIEKHVTLSRKMKGPDHVFAIEMEELRQLISMIRETEDCLKSGKIGPVSAEMEDRTKGRRGIFAKEKILKGETIRSSKLTTVRPSVGLDASKWDSVVGHKARKDIDLYDPLDRSVIGKKAKVAAFIQARMASTRLPGKVLMDLAGKPVLQHVVDRVSRCELIDDIIVATSFESSDDPIEKHCKKNGIKFFRGEHEDALSRFVEAARVFKSDIIVRITADCPLIDPLVISEVIKNHIRSEYEYSHILAEEKYRQALPRGENVEVFWKETLDKLDRLSTTKDQREHITILIDQKPGLFSVNRIEPKSELSRPQYRLTLDTIEDFNLISSVYTHFKDNEFFSLSDIIQFLDDNPSVAKLNATVEQKT
jgi:N-acetylneuraminate synthase/N,N'-diacetyllegionaminate synthase